MTHICKREREHFHIHPIFHFNSPFTVVMMRKLYTTNYVVKEEALYRQKLNSKFMAIFALPLHLNFNFFFVQNRQEITSFKAVKED